jgi:hypothetical protein
MSKPLTTTNAVPVRLTATHYQMASQSKERSGRVYDLIFNHELRRWTCNCPDTRDSHNPRCKHIRQLVAWINEQKIQAEATAVLEQAMSDASAASVEAAACGIEQEYREYAPAGEIPGYITEQEERVAALQDRVLAAECEVALTADQGERQIKELREQLLEEREQRRVLEEQLQKARVQLLEMTALQLALQGELGALQARVAELGQVEPVRISTQSVTIESETRAKRASGAQGEKEVRPDDIKEMYRDGRLVGLEMDGYRVLVGHGMVLGCYCPEGQEKPCEHFKQAEAYLAKKREEAPLNGNRGFQMMR